MTASTLGLNSVIQKNMKRVTQTKAIILTAVVSLSGLVLMLPKPAAAGYPNPSEVYGNLPAKWAAERNAIMRQFGSKVW